MAKRWTIVALALLSAASWITAADSRHHNPSSGITTIRSNDALAFLDIDIENNPGFVASVKGGYQWKFFRGAGIELPGQGVSVSNNFTRNGVAGSVSLGYNFGPRFPLTLGVIFGAGPAGRLNSSTVFGGDQLLQSWQKVGIYSFDASLDYDFKTCTRWTPFVGVTGGVAFITNRGNARITDLGTGAASEGWYGKDHEVNFVIGGRAGTKYDLTNRLQLSLYGSYNYLGSVPGQSFDIGGIDARVKKTRVHQVDAKVGIKIKF